MSLPTRHAEQLKLAINDLRGQGMGRRQVALIVMDAAALQRIYQELEQAGELAQCERLRGAPPQFMGVQIHLVPQAAEIQLITTDGQFFSIPTALP